MNLSICKPSTSTRLVIDPFTLYNHLSIGYHRDRLCERSLKRTECQPLVTSHLKCRIASISYLPTYPSRDVCFGSIATVIFNHVTMNRALQEKKTSSAARINEMHLVQDGYQRFPRRYSLGTTCTINLIHYIAVE